MTNTELRELDAWIATNVFQRDICKCGTRRFLDFEYLCSQCGKYEAVPYSNSPSGFFLLLAKLIADGWHFRAEGPSVDTWYVRLTSFQGARIGREVDAVADSLTEALALATKSAYFQPEVK